MLYVQIKILHILTKGSPNSNMYKINPFMHQ